MRAECPNCHTVYNVKEEQIPIGGKNAKCPNCGEMIFIKREPSENSLRAMREDMEQDYGKTMILFAPLPAQQDSQLLAVQNKIADEKEGMPEGVRLSIRFLDGDDAGKEFELTKTRTIFGRSKADILVNDPEVSRQHAVVEVYGPKLVIRDLQSTNGTFVNQLGVKLSYINDGDEVQVGNTRFTVSMKKG